LIDKAEYWNDNYHNGSTGWDMGHVSPPLKEYFDQMKDKSIKILVPGAGNAWEVEYLHKSGFTNVFLLDFASKSIENFKERCPYFPEENIILSDFFDHDSEYDLIVEQTFLSVFPTEKRNNYVDKISNLLRVGGKYMGVLFNHEFDFQGPPFGGTASDYTKLFKDKFKFIHFNISKNSIKPRMGSELFVLLEKN